MLASPLLVRAPQGPRAATAAATRSLGGPAGGVQSVRKSKSMWVWAEGRHYYGACKITHGNFPHTSLTNTSQRGDERRYLLATLSLDPAARHGAAAMASCPALVCIGHAAPRLVFSAQRCSSMVGHAICKPACHAALRSRSDASASLRWPSALSSTAHRERIRKT